MSRFNESTSKCPKQDTIFSAKYWFNLSGQETSRHGYKNVSSHTKQQYKQTKSTQNYKRGTQFYFFLQLCASTGTQVYL